VRKERLDTTEAFITKDGSEIRELAGTPTGNSVNQSLAEATVPPGADTEEHYHRVSEEIYLFTSGSGRMRLGDEPLRLLCCCAPPYSHDDTFFTR
jgi:mannose-6-phosphate isomerase-like protein (cupin superfamily)